MAQTSCLSLMLPTTCVATHISASSSSPSSPAQCNLGNMVAATQQDTFINTPLHHGTGGVQTPIASISKPSLRSDPLGTWCHWCCDPCNSKSSHVCVNCGMVVCHQRRPNGSGCIGYRSVLKGGAFLCPLCVSKVSGGEESLPYRVIGYGMSRMAKKAWPACIVHITSGNNDYLKDLINIDLMNQYKGYIGNVSHSYLSHPHRQLQYSFTQCLYL
jgi:hypothetical protein